MDVSIKGIYVAALTAGPSVVLQMGIAALIMTAPQTTGFDVETVGSFLLVALFAMLLGFIPALLACMVGSIVMSGLSDRFDFAKTIEAWAVAGVLIAGGIAFAFGAREASLMFALSEGLCAWICRRHLRFDGDRG